MKWIAELFSSSNKASLTRVAFILLVLTAIAISLISALYEKVTAESVALVTTLLVNAFGGKYANGVNETKVRIAGSNNTDNQ